MVELHYQFDSRLNSNNLGIHTSLGTIEFEHILGGSKDDFAKGGQTHSVKQT